MGSSKEECYITKPPIFSYIASKEGIMSNNQITPLKFTKPDSVFWVSISLIILLILIAFLAPQQFGQAMSAASHWTTKNIGWSYLVITFLCVIFMFYVGLSRLGRIRLGQDQERPEFSTISWLSMILAAVMGIGLISYGAAEPLTHFLAPPHGLETPGTYEAAVRALQFSYFDWGPNAWALFGVFGLAIAYSTHRNNNKGLVSPMLRPILGKSMDGWLGKTIDIFTIIATLFGTTTSLGLGAAQVAQGINQLTGIPTTTNIQIIVIAIVTILFTLSAFTGVARGIKYMSLITMAGAAILAAFVYLTGPTNFINNLYFRSIGKFIGEYINIALLTPGSENDLQWMQWWTYFMMAWWLSWAAFIGIFLARISRGRTIREFVIAVLGAPTIVFTVWFTIFGGTAINFEMFKDIGIGTDTLQDTNTTFFAILAELPWTGLSAIITLVMIVLFFVASADSNTFVLSSLSSKGTMNPHKAIITLWGVFTGVVAIVLLSIGGLVALQQAAILSAVPFTVIVLILGASLIKVLHLDPIFQGSYSVTHDELKAILNKE